MKKLVFIIALLMAHSAFAMNFIFDPSPDSSVTGYVVYWTDGNEVWNKDIGNENTFALPDNYFFPEKTYEVWARAYDAYGCESVDSNHLQFYAPVTGKPAQDKLPVEFYEKISPPGGMRKL